MKTIKNFIIYLYTLLFISCQVVAGPIYSDASNLLTNGSFETPVISNNSWKHFTAEDVEGWELSSVIAVSDGSEVHDGRIEIWNGLFNIPASQGMQFAELNAHPAQEATEAFQMSQSFVTQANQNYVFSFDYRARNRNDGQFTVELFDLSSPNAPLIDMDVTNNDTANWSVFNPFIFAGNGNEYRIQFTSLSPGTDTTGHLFDAIYVGTTFGPASIPEPNTLFIFGLSMFGLIAARKRNTKHK